MQKLDPKTSSGSWTGIFEADPNHPDIARLMKEWPPNEWREGRTPGGAGCELYGERAEQAGAKTQWIDDNVDIELGTIDVLCRTDPNMLTEGLRIGQQPYVPSRNDFQLLAVPR